MKLIFGLLFICLPILSFGNDAPVPTSCVDFNSDVAVLIIARNHGETNKEFYVNQVKKEKRLTEEDKVKYLKMIDAIFARPKPITHEEVVEEILQITQLCLEYTI